MATQQKSSLARFAPLLILLLVGALLYGYWRSKQPNTWTIRNDPPPSGPIVALGDSLTAGSGAGPGRGYVDLLSRDLGREILNAGVPGDTSADALRRLDRDVLRHNPGVVIVFLGGNDLLRRGDSTALFANLRQIISACQDAGAMTVLVGIEPPGLMSSTDYGELFEGLARETGSLYVPDILSGIFGRPSLMADQIHPNAAGYEKVAERIAEAIESKV